LAYSAKEKWKRDLSQFVETELSHFGLVAPSLGGLPNQLGSGSETNSLEAGMCTRGIENNEGGLRFSYHNIMVQHPYVCFASSLFFETPLLRSACHNTEMLDDPNNTAPTTTAAASSSSSNNRPNRSSNTALRPLSAELSTLSQSDGSASLQVGNTHVLCAIHGPAAPRNTNAATIGGDDGRCGVISVVFSRGLTASMAGTTSATTATAAVTTLTNTANDSGETSTAADGHSQQQHNNNTIIHHPMPPGLGATEREMEKFVHDALSACILLDHYPRCVIQVVIQIVQADGSVLGSAVNCAILALLDAGIAMKNLLVATTCCIIVDDNISIWLDPTAEEESGAGYGIVVLVTTNDGSTKTATTTTMTTATATSPIVHVMHTFGTPIPLKGLLSSVKIAARYGTPAMLAFARLVVERKVKQEIETLWS